MSYTPDYPFPKLEYGETFEVAPGVHWIRMPLPFALNHINLWLLRDGDGWAVVDTGYNVDRTRQICLCGPMFSVPRSRRGRCLGLSQPS